MSGMQGTGQKLSSGASRVLPIVFALLLSGLLSSPALADSSSTGGAPGTAPSSLLDAWLSYSDATDTQWPYAFIVAEDTARKGNGVKSDLFDEFDRLHWRLVNGGYPKLAKTVEQWESRLEKIRHFRTPGDWSPAFLLSHPNHRPPMKDIAAIGTCKIPSTIGVWSGEGYTALAWQSNMRLSDVEKAVPAVRRGSVPEIAVVDPYGRIDHYGVQAWNYADGYVAPGTQVVASLPLKGEAFGWIRDTMAQLLAHRPSGVDCHRESFNTGESTRD